MAMAGCVKLFQVRLVRRLDLPGDKCQQKQYCSVWVRTLGETETQYLPTERHLLAACTWLLDEVACELECHRGIYRRNNAKHGRKKYRGLGSMVK